MQKIKDSGIEWIGEIPNEWSVSRLRNFYSFEKGKRAAIYTKEYVAENVGNVPVYSGQTEADGIMGFVDSYDYDFEECIFTTTVGANVMTLKILHGKFCLSQNCLIMTSKNLCNNHFMFHFLNALFQYEKSAIPSYMQPSLRISDLKKYSICLPDLKIQQRIADYLDSKCAKIDNLIAHEENTIEELKVYKQSVISEAVTKGLDKTVLLKDSGVEWNRIIPTHWKSVYPKILFSQRKDRAQKGDRQLTASQNLGIIYQGEFMQACNQKVVLVEKDFDILKKVEPNDFVISMRSFQGGLEYSTLSGAISSAYVMIIPNEKVYPPFYRWLFKSSVYINALQSTSNLVRDGQAMRFANFVQIYLFEIPLHEQQQIANYLDKKCVDIENLISIKQQKIEELKEYKKSLIYEYVTGKKEVV